MHKFKLFIVLLLSVLLLASCVSTKNYSPNNKFSSRALQKDFSLLRNILEAKHPSLYWYTSKDSMDYYFNQYYTSIKDSMTEQQFIWKILAPTIDKIHCGHTSIGSSKAYVKWIRGKQLPSFPLYFKVWNDSLAVTGNLNRKDSVFKRGTIVTAINHQKPAQLIGRIFNYLPEDGYANNINYIRMSGNFPYYHRNIYGLSKTYSVDYIDASGNAQTVNVPLWTPAKDTTKKKRDSLVRKTPKPPKFSKEKQLQSLRSFTIDSSGKFATITLNTFSNGRLRSFFRRSFREIRKTKIDQLILDVRSNGGGKVMSSTLLTKYLSNSPFKIADSVYSKARGVGPYGKNIKGGFLNSIEMFFISRKKIDGKYHIGHLERKLYRPKRKNHYSGKLYVLINGPSFSATSLLCNNLKGQKNILLVGEETGGGWHGNSGIMIPDIKLPNTKTSVRLPLYRVVQYKHVPKTGTGVLPDWYIGTSYEALIKGYDYKMSEVIKRIMHEVATKN
ncbi:MAG TPA: S41 family peptidase [Ferruginibacter sp.]|nr:S41 family peptidase [Ferruginibacter sp.]HRE63613.1 S41 family peptidase [Ferruginibacter sp.]